MMLTTLILAASPTLAAPAGDVLAIKARHVETGTGETLEHAVILVEDGLITMIGEDLPIERGIPVLELEEDQWVLPGLVNAYSRYGLGGQGYSDLRPYIKASDELSPGFQGALRGAAEAGVTTLGLYPAGRGIPGQAVVVQTAGGDLVLQDPGYLKVVIGNSSSEKRYLRDGFKKADEWVDKEAKNKEKYEKAKEKADKEKDKDKQKEELAKLGEYQPVESDPRGQAFLDLRAKSFGALFSIDKAADYLHLLDALGEEDIEWDLRMALSTESDFFHVSERIGKLGKRVVMEPELTLHPGTLRQRNLPAELQRAGAKLVLMPRSDSSAGFATWLRDTGVIVAAGLERSAAVRALTLEPAELLGVADRVGSLEVGKHANLIVIQGDPFEVGSEVEAVMVRGAFVHGEDEL